MPAVTERMLVSGFRTRKEKTKTADTSAMDHLDPHGGDTQTKPSDKLDGSLGGLLQAIHLVLMWHYRSRGERADAKRDSDIQAAGGKATSQYSIETAKKHGKVRVWEMNDQQYTQEVERSSRQLEWVKTSDRVADELRPEALAQIRAKHLKRTREIQEWEDIDLPRIETARRKYDLLSWVQRLLVKCKILIPKTSDPFGDA